MTPGSRMLRRPIGRPCSGLQGNPGVSKESWDKVLALPADPLNQELPAGGNNTPGVGPLTQATSGETPTQAKPEEETGAQKIVLQEVACEDSDTNPREAAGHPALDDPPSGEAAGGVIETRMTRGPEYPGVTSPGDVNESPEATSVPVAIYLYHWRSTRTCQS